MPKSWALTFFFIPPCFNSLLGSSFPKWASEYTQHSRDLLRNFSHRFVEPCLHEHFFLCVRVATAAPCNREKWHWHEGTSGLRWTMHCWVALGNTGKQTGFLTSDWRPFSLRKGLVMANGMHHEVRNFNKTSGSHTLAIPCHVSPIFRSVSTAAFLCTNKCVYTYTSTVALRTSTRN